MSYTRLSDNDRSATVYASNPVASAYTDFAAQPRGYGDFPAAPLLHPDLSLASLAQSITQGHKQIQCELFTSTPTNFIEDADMMSSSTCNHLRCKQTPLEELKQQYSNNS